MEPIQIESFERDVLIEEARALMGSLKDPAAQARYAELIVALETGSIPEALLNPLEKLLELGLRTDRIRKVHGPQAAKAILRLFNKTHQGLALEKATAEVNEALQILAGHVIEEITFSPSGPGLYGLVIDTDRCRLTLEVGERGIWVKDVGIGV